MVERTGIQAELCGTNNSNVEMSSRWVVGIVIHHSKFDGHPKFDEAAIGRVGVILSRLQKVVGVVGAWIPPPSLGVEVVIGAILTVGWIARCMLASLAVIVGPIPDAAGWKIFRKHSRPLVVIVGGAHKTLPSLAVVVGARIPLPSLVVEVGAPLTVGVVQTLLIWMVGAVEILFAWTARTSFLPPLDAGAGREVLSLSAVIPTIPVLSICATMLGLTVAWTSRGVSVSLKLDK
jgi:hypothetical protein